MESPLAKIAITAAADESLTQAMARVNQGFEGGRVSKTNVASWLILRASEGLSPSDIVEIRHTHFNHLKYLEILLRKLKATGRESLDPAEFALLQETCTQRVAKGKAKPAGNHAKPGKSGPEPTDRVRDEDQEN